MAEGVWVVQGQPGRCNVYLIEDDGGVTLFDAGARTMTRAVASAGAKLGGIRRVVLGHGAHRPPRRGARVGRARPVPPRRGPGRRGQRRLSLLAARPRGPAHAAAPDPPAAAPLRLGRRAGEDLGHASARATRWRASRDRAPRPRARPDRAVARVRPPGAEQRLLLHARHVGSRLRRPRCPRRLYNFDTEQARASIRKLAALEPAAAWPGHAKPRHRRRAQPARTSCRRGLSVGRRARRQAPREARPRRAATTPTREGNVLTLRGSLTPGARREYAQALGGAGDARRGHPGGRLAARGRAAVRAPGGPLGDRRRADRAPARAAGALARGLPRGAHVGAPGAARALRRALPRRAGAVTSLSRTR